MSLLCVVPLRLSYSFGFYGLPQFLNWWLGIDIDHWSKFVFVLVAMFLLFAAMISEVSRQPIWPFQKVRWKRAWVSAWRRLKPFGGLSFPKPFAWLFQIWRRLSWTSCATPLWLIPLALSISWEQETTWSVAILEIIPRDLYSRSSDLLGYCPCDFLLRSIAWKTTQCNRKVAYGFQFY